MGLFTSFNNKDQGRFQSNASTERLVIDLARFTVGQTPIGKPPWEGDFFAQAVLAEGSLENPSAGYELTGTNGTLSSVFLDLENFGGTLLNKGEMAGLSPETTLEEVRELFGEPYWTDQDDEEVLLFYEYEKGSTELQFEFPDGRHLGYLTLIHEGVLSKPEQRKSYGVTKPWPPSDPA